MALHIQRKRMSAIGVTLACYGSWVLGLWGIYAAGTEIFW
jgi:hypothetical protein